MTEAQYAEYMRTRARLRSDVQAATAALGDTARTMAKPAKYRNTKTELDGYLFDSKKEAARWQELRLLERAGIITGLELQPEYELHTVSPSGEPVVVGKLTLDFRYRQDSVLVVEDVKSDPTKTQVYRLRKRIFEAEYGLSITEV